MLHKDEGISVHMDRILLKGHSVIQTSSFYGLNNIHERSLHQNFSILRFCVNILRFMFLNLYKIHIFLFLKVAFRYSDYSDIQLNFLDFAYFVLILLSKNKKITFLNYKRSQVQFPVGAELLFFKNFI